MSAHSADFGAVFVSAGAGGAGRVIAEMFADAGARVTVCDIDRSAVAVLQADRPDIEAVAMDAGEETQVNAVIAKIEQRWGAVNVLINNVGIGGPTQKVEELALDDWNRVLRTNLTSHFLFCRRVVPAMKAQARGLIVNISSASARTGLPLRLPYVVSKGALLSMTMNLARELGPSGIRVNAILPGGIRGRRIVNIIEQKAAALGIDPEAYAREQLRYVSLRTLIDPADIGSMALFLASPQGAKITGQMIGVDGNCEYEE